jgi:hypothetical protein
MPPNGRHKLQGRGTLGKPGPAGWVVSAVRKPTAAPCQLDAIVRQRIWHPAGRSGGLGPGAGALPEVGRSRGGRAAPTAVCPRHTIWPVRRAGNSSARPDRGSRPPRSPSTRMTGGGSGRAGFAIGGLGAGPGAYGGRCAGPTLPLTRRTARELGARPGPGPARPGRGLDVMTGLRCPR